ncbi:MAG: class I SAM-dependent methyltransferase [Thermaerobacter sp.]|nr:class I SAM-dependent methyltransferase [Thermaerobacter sp.]
MNGGLPDITDDLQLLLKRAVFFDPWLAALTEQDLEPRVELVLDEGVRDLMRHFWTERDRAQALGVLPVYDQLVSESLRTCILSTACLRAVWDGLPRVPNEARMLALLKDLHEFSTLHGLGAIVRASIGVLAYENISALDYYDGIREEDFLQGRLHRPWVASSLSSELTLMLTLDAAAIEMSQGVRYVRLTPHGRKRGRELGDQLRAAKYIDRRVQALYVAHFDLNTDGYDHLFDRFIPSLPLARKRLLEIFAPVQGSRVLELGSGTGIFTFETGLCRAVGPDGELYALEPAQEMTTVARQRAQMCSIRSVRFVQGRAESTPFEDGLFDGVVSSLMLHFADAERTFAECFRILRPGGRVAMLWMFAWDIQESRPFFEWMEPMQALVQRPHESGFTNRRFLTLEHAQALLTRAGFVDVHTERMALPHELWHVEDVVRATLAMGVYQREFEQLPWAARQDLIRELIARGEAARQRYSHEELTATNYAGFLSARRPDEPGRHLRPAISLERRRRVSRTGGA